MVSTFYPITPVPAPRQVRSDTWNPSDAVLRYRAFKDECRLRKLDIKSGDRVVFVMPMPDSWSGKKRVEMAGKPHLQKPDVDNMIKAALDALYSDDAHIWDLHIQKIWGWEGAIKVYRGDV